jgi:pheromone shutdown protein TraB
MHDETCTGWLINQAEDAGAVDDDEKAVKRVVGCGRKNGIERRLKERKKETHCLVVYLASGKVELLTTAVAFLGLRARSTMAK